MTDSLSAPLPASPQQTFEEIKKLDDDGVEYWHARKLAAQLDYADWRNFENVIEKSKVACTTSGQNVDDHFVDITDMIETAKGATRRV